MHPSSKTDERPMSDVLVGSLVCGDVQRFCLQCHSKSRDMKTSGHQDPSFFTNTHVRGLLISPLQARDGLLPTVKPHSTIP